MTRLSLNDATAEGVQTADTSDVRIRSLPNEYGCWCACAPDGARLTQGRRGVGRYRFMLYRHWSLYESMRHSPYVATQLHLWQEKGLSTFQMMFARMGYGLRDTPASALTRPLTFCFASSTDCRCSR